VENLQAGLTEMRRLAKGPVVILTCDPDEVESFWLRAYALEVLATESRRYPSMYDIKEVPAGPVVITAVPIQFNCKDGFNEAYYGRPEGLREEGLRLACSAWSLVDKSSTDSYVLDLSRELRNGSWDSKYGHLRTQSQFDGSIRLIVSEP
jgi:hypothetical protein